jgi:hypothetical protein
MYFFTAEHGFQFFNQQSLLKRSASQYFVTLFGETFRMSKARCDTFIWNRLSNVFTQSLIVVYMRLDDFIKEVTKIVKQFTFYFWVM